MTPEEAGRYCEACSTVVYDLTKATYSQIHRKAAENNNDLCVKVDERRARFTGLQRRNYRRVRRFVVAAMLVFGANLFAFDSVAEANTCQMLLEEFVNPPKAQQRFSGKAVDKDNGLALANTRLVIYLDDDRITTVTTDDEGMFKLVLPFGDENETLSFDAKSKSKYDRASVDLTEEKDVEEVQLIEFVEEEAGIRGRKFKWKQKRRLRRMKRNRRHFVGKF